MSETENSITRGIRASVVTVLAGPDIEALPDMSAGHYSRSRMFRPERIRIEWEPSDDGWLPRSVNVAGSLRLKSGDLSIATGCDTTFHAAFRTRTLDLPPDIRALVESRPPIGFVS